VLLTQKPLFERMATLLNKKEGLHLHTPALKPSSLLTHVVTAAVALGLSTSVAMATGSPLQDPPLDPGLVSAQDHVLSLLATPDVPASTVVRTPRPEGNPLGPHMNFEPPHCEIVLHYDLIPEAFPFLKPLATDMADPTAFREARTVDIAIQHAFQGRMDASSEALRPFLTYMAAFVAAHEQTHCKGWHEVVEPLVTQLQSQEVAALPEDTVSTLFARAKDIRDRTAVSEPLADVVGHLMALRGQPTAEALLWADRFAQGRVRSETAFLEYAEKNGLFLNEEQKNAAQQYRDAGYAVWGFLNALHTENPKTLLETIRSADMARWIEKGKAMAGWPDEKRRAHLSEHAPRALAALGALKKNNPTFGHALGPCRRGRFVESLGTPFFSVSQVGSIA
jgi:hypothetical protein